MKYLGVDFGLKRAGLAISEGNLASAWKVITAKTLTQLIEEIYRQSAGFDKVVIGMPEGRMGKLTQNVVKILSNRGLDIVAVDETLSTQKARQLMIELNVPKKKRAVTDAQAAAIILQNYLDFP